MSYCVGVNGGPAAGHTVPHLHVHLKPRFSGDSLDPSGGVRFTTRGKADYQPT
ncbi:MAG: HIT domain-containing protein [Betaproteobacteria bacterium]|nr:HIT domain-containing protein [Betaproteobacteria bacterium]